MAEEISANGFAQDRAEPPLGEDGSGSVMSPTSGAARPTNLASLFGDDKDPQPMWLDKSAFLDPSFDPDAYIATVRRIAPLESVRAELREHLAALKSELVELINRDYNDFVNLSTKLVDVDGAVLRMRVPLTELRAQLLAVRSSVAAAPAALEDGLARRAEAATARQILELLLDTSNVLSKVEKLLLELHAMPDAPPPPPSSASASSSTSSSSASASASASAPPTASASPAKRPPVSLSAAAARNGPVKGGEGEGSAGEEGGDAGAGVGAGRDAERELEEARSRLLERIASEMNRLNFYVAKGKDLPFVRSVEGRIRQASSTLAAHLRRCLERGLHQRWRRVVYHCLRAFASLDAAADAEELFRRAVVAPLVAQALLGAAAAGGGGGGGAGGGKQQQQDLAPSSPKSPSSPTSAGAAGDLLQGVYERIEEGVSEACRFVVGIVASADAGLHVFQFLAASVLKEVAAALHCSHAAAFSPGRPAQFLLNYKASLDFLAFLEGFCTSRESLTSFRAHPCYTDFLKGWNLAVYYASRFREIAGLLDDALVPPPASSAAAAARMAVQRAAAPGMGVGLHASVVLWDALQRCWHPAVFIPCIADKFLRLTLQLLSRFGKWVMAGVAARRAGSAADNPGGEWGLAATPEDLALMWHDLLVLSSNIRAAYVGELVQQMGQGVTAEVRAAVRGEVEGAADALHALTAHVAALLSDITADRCIEVLRPVRAIAAMYRVPSRPPPTRHSHYVPGVLQPLKVVLEGDKARAAAAAAGAGGAEEVWSEEMRAVVVGQVVERVTQKFDELAKEVVATARRTESSLKLLQQRSMKRPPGAADAGGASGMSDTDKIIGQLFLDVQEYGRIIRTFGLEPTTVAPFASFWKRRRRAILITLGVVGVGVGSYVVYQRLHARLLEDQQRIQRQQQQILEEAIREAEEKRRAEEEREDAQIRAHFESIQRIADATTLPSVLPHLRTQLFSSINLTALTDALFSSRQHAASATAGSGGGGEGAAAAAPRAPLSAQEKLRIWEDLKVLSFCRTLCGMWSLALLSLFVRAQLNVLGRRVFLDAAVRSASSSSLQDPQQQARRKRQLPMRCQHQFIALADYLPQIGLRALTRDAQAFIAPILERLSLRDNISLPQLLSLIHDIRLEFEARDCATWQRYLLPLDNYLPADLAATSLAADASAGRGASGQGLGGMGEGGGGARMGGGGGMEDEEEQALLGELMDELRHVLSSYEFQEALSASLDALTEAAHEHLAAAEDAPRGDPMLKNPIHKVECSTAANPLPSPDPASSSRSPLLRSDASQTAVPAWPQKDAGPYGSNKAPARPDVAPLPSSYPTAVLPLGVPGDSALAVFSYNDLRAATEGFRSDNRLGEGGFGIVYKGWVCMRPGVRPEEVAVKVLNHEGLQGHKEWLAEVNFLGQVYHPHLVRLIGYCAEAEQRLLVYEFMCNGSLEVHLFRQHLTVLPWSTRMKIALGAARGLAYLHEEATRPIIYRDFKTSNILLAEDFSAKLSDFGLAKDGPESGKTHVSTRVMGTYGYAAPEYVMTGGRAGGLGACGRIPITPDSLSPDFPCHLHVLSPSPPGHLTLKSDVYSYGVVLLEMITGRRSMDKSFPPEEHSLVDWSRPFLSDRRKVFRLLDSRLDGMYSVKGAQHAMALAQSCLNRDPKARPIMSDAVKILEALQDLDDMAVYGGGGGSGRGGGGGGGLSPSSPGSGSEGGGGGGGGAGGRGEASWQQQQGGYY
ncbi:unnamed protein product [Closterium sp. Naga37s-1]|nr:unnamed protein product [Closterium sp. Naga37s-1]